MIVLHCSQGFLERALFDFLENFYGYGNISLGDFFQTVQYDFDHENSKADKGDNSYWLQTDCTLLQFISLDYQITNGLNHNLAALIIKLQMAEIFLMYMYIQLSWIGNSFKSKYSDTRPSLPSLSLSLPSLPHCHTKRQFCF